MRFALADTADLRRRILVKVRVAVYYGSIMLKSVFLLLILAIQPLQDSGFKSEQLRYSRVRSAYAEKESLVLGKLNDQEINVGMLEVYIRAFKEEEMVELWGRNSIDTTFRLVDQYEFCSSSGQLGPKRRQGDYQIPEGFYFIDRFNPFSSFHLSLGINYPNRSDRILGDSGNLGGDIFIHGACVTIGCIPITDDKIKELYLYCVEAKNNGQTRIEVSIFPARLNQENYDHLLKNYPLDQSTIHLWTDLKEGYDYFETHISVPEVRILGNGRYRIGG